ncbi:LacI family DNA-binding transcriptional regulator [Sinorhizobium meliloti]|jgi:LacI family transcriptional regulator|uniref:LacI family DNA-binding transcriptional regulator n=1 Tax=Rhizobium meliloti TaxID=382 RepID=UPI000FDA4931|nr:LacI family DNA-binding transcriptional regulator [Sinorhizobium meliloti]RVH47627.1 LacI family DNA-binding transcriptional regulator [Sinorhizobium meliloti]RVO70181.1 LacI family DNA-binding transcriptional regulator [Sinorhizobium meliloti]
MGATIKEVAELAGVSTATVDRVINGRPGVKATNRHRVLEAAARLGYLPETGDLAMPARPARLEFFLPVGGNQFLSNLAHQIEDFCRRLPLVASYRVHRLEDARPQSLLEAIDRLDVSTAGVGIVAVDEPRTRAAVVRLIDAGLRVVTIASDLPSTPRANYVGIDNRIAGRTAGLLMGAMLRRVPATIGLFLGSRRYRGHDEREAGFRSVLAERFPGVVIAEVLEIEDDSQRGYKSATSLLSRFPDLGGIYIAGGGRSGVIAAITEAGHAQRPLVFCHDLTDQTRESLLDDGIDIVIDQNARLMAEQATIQLLGTLASSAPYLTKKLIEPRIITRENIPAA